MPWLSADNLVWSIKVSWSFSLCMELISTLFYVIVSDTIANGCPAKGLNITETFLMNDVMCTGAEETLLECPHTEDVVDCIHSEAVVVECDSEYIH